MNRLMGSADLFAARWDGRLPGGLAAGRRPAYGLNGITYVGKAICTPASNMPMFTKINGWFLCRPFVVPPVCPDYQLA